MSGPNGKAPEGFFIRKECIELLLSQQHETSPWKMQTLVVQNSNMTLNACRLPVHRMGASSPEPAGWTISQLCDLKVKETVNS